MFRWTYLELLSARVPEAVQMQHRETQHRQLRETESKIFQTGFNHLRKDRQKENLDHPAVLAGNNSQNTSSTSPSETLEQIWRETHLIQSFSEGLQLKYTQNEQKSREIHAEGILKVEKTGYHKLQNLGLHVQQITKFSMQRTNRECIIDMR